MNESAAPAPGVLRVGRVPGVVTTKWHTRWEERIDARLEVVDVAETDARGALDNDEVDLCFARLPLDREGLHAIPLCEETAVAWVSKDHPIAAFDDVTLADLADETVLRKLDGVAIDRVNAGAVLIVPQSIARNAGRRDLTYRPVVDEPPTRIVLAWRTDNDHPLIEELIGIVRGRSATSSRTSREREARGDEPRDAKNPARTPQARTPQTRKQAAQRGRSPRRPRRR